MAKAKSKLTEAMLKVNRKLQNVRDETEEVIRLLESLLEKGELTVKKLMEDKSKIRIKERINDAAQELDSFLDKLFKVKAIYYNFGDDDDDDDNNDNYDNYGNYGNDGVNGVSENDVSYSSNTSNSALESHVKAQLSKEDHEFIVRILSRESSRSRNYDESRDHYSNSNIVDNIVDAQMRAFNGDSQSVEMMRNNSDINEGNASEVSNGEIGNVNPDFMEKDYINRMFLKPKALSTQDFSTHSSNFLIANGLNYSFPNDRYKFSYHHSHRPSTISRTEEIYSLNQQLPATAPSSTSSVPPLRHDSPLPSKRLIQTKSDEIMKHKSKTSSMAAEPSIVSNNSSVSSNYMTPVSEFASSFESLSNSTIRQSSASHSAVTLKIGEETSKEPTPESVDLTPVSTPIVKNKVFLAVNDNNEPSNKMILNSKRIVKMTKKCVRIAYINKLTEFYVFLDTDDPTVKIQRIQKEQEKLIKNNDKDFPIELGAYCAAQFSDDQLWYRAKIIKIVHDNENDQKSKSDGPIKEVCVDYVDWGNSETVPLNRIMKLSPILNHSIEAVRCSLKDINSYGIITGDENAIVAFNDISYEENSMFRAIFFDFFVTDGSDTTHNVELFFKDKKTKCGEMINILSEIKLKMDISRVNSRVKQYASDDLKAILTEVDDSSVIEKPKSRESVENPKVNDNSSHVIEKPKDVPKNNNNNNLSSTPSSSNHRESLELVKVPYTVIPETEYILSVVSHVISPSNFYIHILNSQESVSKLDELHEQLNLFYSNPINDNEFDFHKIVPNTFWACLYQSEQLWSRVRVLKLVDMTCDITLNSLVSVQFIDYANIETVKIMDLRPLEPQFAIIPAFSVRCSLSEVSPYNGDKWPDDVITYFSSISGYESESISTIYISNRPEKIDYNTVLQVFLWNTADDGRDVLVNAKLVSEKMAHSDSIDWVLEAERAEREKTPPDVAKKSITQMTTGIVQSSVVEKPKEPKICYLPEDIDEIDEFDQLFDPMEEDYKSDRNNYKVTDDDIETVLLQFKPKEVVPCKFYRKGWGCHKGDICEFKHISDKQYCEVTDQDEAHIRTADLHDDLLLDSIVDIKVTAIQNPNSFFGILPFGCVTFDKIKPKVLINDPNSVTDADAPELKKYFEICSQLRAYYSKSINKENTALIHPIGTLVAVRNDKTGKYFRACVNDIKDDRRYIVFDIDCGNLMEVERSQIFKLNEYFCAHPALAVNFSLANIESINGVWNDEAIATFAQLTLDKHFAAHIISKDLFGKVYVELLGIIDNEEVSITELLINKNLAKSVPNSHICLNVSQINKDDDEIYYSD